MNNFILITPSELKRKHPETEQSVEELREIANQPDAECENCHEKVWKYGQTGFLCFSCTTGEADASNDYELIPEDE